MSADDQQERSRTEGWVVGFVDGEGCFSLSVLRNETTRSGWQVFPEFVVTQGAKSRDALEELRKFFGCGRIFVNRRHDNHREDLHRYCVRRIADLREKIVPFFERCRLRTSKRESFECFKEALEMIAQGRHLTEAGLRELAQLASRMNKQKLPRFLKSSETVRRDSR